MKVLFALISIFLLSFIYSDETKTCEGIVTKKSECHDIKLSDEKKCCYFNYIYTEDGKELEIKGCGDLTKAEYDDIDKYIDDMKKDNEKDEKFKLKSLDCNSYYLHITILSLIFILI